jgi:hypothetical protein
MLNIYVPREFRIVKWIVIAGISVVGLAELSLAAIGAYTAFTWIF